MDTVSFNSGALERWTRDIFVAVGMAGEDAALAAEVLVRTSLRGIDTHGISRVPQYVEAIEGGQIKPRPTQRSAYDDGVLRYWADTGVGQAAGMAAMRKAVELAGTHPFVPALVIDCGHLGALGTYVLAAAEAGVFALICQATSPLMALPGSRGRSIGNNPLAFATPVGRGRPPLVFDMASSIVARGLLRQSIREGTPIPEGWAIDPDGNPTTDPEAAWAGAMLPVGDYKGIGIAMLIQCLAGSFIGNTAALDSSAGPVSSAMGAFILVANPRLIGSAYASDVDVWVSRYLRVSGNGARYPGARAAESEARRSREGIPVPPGLLQQMRDVAERLKVPLPAKIAA